MQNNLRKNVFFYVVFSGIIKHKIITIVGEENMKHVLFLFLLLPMSAFAVTQVPSNAYMEKFVSEQIDVVEQELATKVDTSATANQELNGTYVITNPQGLIVPTQEMPAVVLP
jgi:MFS-type transporter involved in bile tolerance (Atg22 family)